MSNEAYKWLKEWVKSGEWSIEASGDGVCHLCLNLSRSHVSVEFRKHMTEVIEAAERGGINERGV